MQNKVAHLERQLKAAQSVRRPSLAASGSGSGSAAPADAPSSSSSFRPSRHQGLPKDPNALAGFASPADEPTLTASIWSTVRDIWALRMNMEPEETDTLLRFLAAQTSAPYAGQLELGRSNVHWRLAEPLMAKVLTIHLLEGKSGPLLPLPPPPEPLPSQHVYVLD